MKKLVFATNNQHKTLEVREILKPKFEVLNLNDIGCDVDIPEIGHTFAENAAIKSSYVFNHYSLDCFADDSGLEVGALHGEPGIFSARYSGQRGDAVNMAYLLEKMKDVTDRRARFKTVISLLLNGKQHFFEGLINGEIRHEAVGTNGFGYDPIFQPIGYNITFAEMDLSAKNKISHRALAMQQLIQFLHDQQF